MNSGAKMSLAERDRLLPKLAQLETATARKNFLDANRALVRVDIVDN